MRLKFSFFPISSPSVFFVLFENGFVLSENGLDDISVYTVSVFFIRKKLWVKETYKFAVPTTSKTYKFITWTFLRLRLSFFYFLAICFLCTFWKRICTFRKRIGWYIRIYLFSLYFLKMDWIIYPYISILYIYFWNQSNLYNLQYLFKFYSTFNHCNSLNSILL